MNFSDFEILRPGRLAGLILLCLALSLPSVVQAQLFTRMETLPWAVSASQRFGNQVVASGDTVVATTNNGIQVFVRGAEGYWVHQRTISQGWIGNLAIDGDTLVNGRYVWFRLAGDWSQQQNLGESLYDPHPVVQGNTMVVGDPSPPYPTQNTPGYFNVYVWNGTKWVGQGGSTGSDTHEQLGMNVALDGDTAVIGIGSGYFGHPVYVRNGTSWTQQGKLRPPYAGGPVAVEGNTAVTTDRSSIFIFERAGTTWTQTQTLTPVTSGWVGRFVLNGGVLAVISGGRIDVFARTASGWVFVQTLTSPGVNYSALALTNGGKLLVAGDPDASPNGVNQAGMVHVYSVPAPAAPGSGWHDFDIGPVGVAGSSTDHGTQVQVTGSGADIWDRADQFHYRTESLRGDGAIIARVDSAGAGHPWSKVGLMFRESIAPAARNVTAVVAAGSPVGMQVRSTTAETTSFTDAPWLGAPLWLMLARAGNLFAAYRSNDGDNWTPIGSATVAMPETVHVGLAVSSHDNTTTNTGVFSGLELVRSDVPPPPPPPNAPGNLVASLASPNAVRLQWTDNSNNETNFRIERSPGTGDGDFSLAGTVVANAIEFTDSGLGFNATYTYRVRATNGAAASDVSNTYTITTGSEPPTQLSVTPLGAPTISGSFTQNGDTVTLDTAGVDIWGNEDNGAFAYRSITGDFDVRAHITSLTNTHPWAKAGVMARVSLAANAPNLFTMISAAAASGIQTRATFGGTTLFVEAPWVTAPYWVRLTRTNNHFESFISEDGANWQLVKAYDPPFGATMYVGVAASSHTANTRTHVVFENVSFGR